MECLSQEEYVSRLGLSRCKGLWEQAQCVSHWCSALDYSTRLRVGDVLEECGLSCCILLPHWTQAVTQCPAQLLSCRCSVHAEEWEVLGHGSCWGSVGEPFPDRKGTPKCQSTCFGFQPGSCWWEEYSGQGQGSGKRRICFLLP